MPAYLGQSKNFMASLALMVAVLAIMLTFAMRTTPCAYAASGSCSVGDLETFTSAITVNEDGNDADTRFEGDTEANLLYIDAGNDAVLIGAAAPIGSEDLYVVGDARIDGNLVVNTAAKGGLLAGTAADTFGIRTIGTDGQVLLADSGQSTGMIWGTAPGVTFLDKTADETVNNSTTLQNDDDLTFPVLANKNYAFWGVFIIDSGATPDLKVQWSVPSGATAEGITMQGFSGTYQEFLESASAQINGAGAGTATSRDFHGTIKNGANAGTAVVQWAQNTIDVSDTKMLAGTWLAFQELN